MGDSKKPVTGNKYTPYVILSYYSYNIIVVVITLTGMASVMAALTVGRSRQSRTVTVENVKSFNGTRNVIIMAAWRYWCCCWYRYMLPRWPRAGGKCIQCHQKWPNTKMYQNAFPVETLVYTLRIPISFLKRVKMKNSSKISRRCIILLVPSMVVNDRTQFYYHYTICNVQYTYTYV